MTAQNDLDRTLRAWFDADATATPPPEPLALVIESTRSIRPRHPLIAGIGSAWTDADGAKANRRFAKPRPLLRLALIAILAVALVGGFIAGALILGRHVPVPGLFAYSRDGVVYLSDKRGRTIPVAHQDGYYLDVPITMVGSAWSPDGRYLAIDKGLDGRFPDADPAASGVLVLDATTSDLRRVAGGSFIGWRPDARHLIAKSEQGEIVELSLDDGSARTIGAVGTVGAATLSPDGRWIAVMDGGRLDTIDVVTGARATLYDNGADLIDIPAWSPESNWIAFARTRSPQCHTCIGPVVIVSKDGGHLTTLTRADGSAWHARWSPDGAFIAYTGLDPDRSYGFDVIRPDGTDRRRLIGREPGYVDGLLDGGDRSIQLFAWSSDQTVIRYLNGSLDEAGSRYGLYEIDVNGGEPRRLDGGAGMDSFAWQSVSDGSEPSLPDGTGALPSPH